MPMRACVHLITNPGTARDLAITLSKIDGVTSTDLTTGRFDIMVLVDKEDAGGSLARKGPVMSRIPTDKCVSFIPFPTKQHMPGKETG